jgi:hypothetical protein
MPIAAIFATIGAETVALTAAEVAAAEAAKIAAAEAAAAAAAETAAAAATQQATQAAAQQAAQQTAQQAATSSAANVGSAEALNLAAQQQAAQQAGIMGIEGATASQPLTAEAVQQAAMNQGVQITPLEGFPQDIAARRIPVNLTPDQIQAATGQPAGIAGLQGSSAEALNIAAQQQAAGIMPPPQGLADPSLAMQPGPVAPAPANVPMSYDSFGNPALQGSPAATMADPTGLAQLQQSAIAAPTPSPLETGMDKAIKFAEKNPFTAMTGAYLGANALGLMDPSGATFNDDKYDGPLNRFRLSPDFKGSTANPANFQYTPKRYAIGGGIMGANSYDIPVGYAQGEMVGSDVPEYAKGGSLSDSIEQYQKMMDGGKQAAPTRAADVGIYYDQDPDTRYQDAMTAAQIRQAKVNQRAYVSPPVAKRPTPMGQLQMASVKPRKQGDEVEAARGGIMQSSLGGYAAGGNPRLLKGPGDGMSDNIPATINGRQPARLADGEFVIPADVVSHLGNGSTEAGAKQLHAMMNKIRKARTGNPKQGKQINPSKFLPK